jgi:hypothetical protein
MIAIQACPDLGLSTRHATRKARATAEDDHDALDAAEPRGTLCRQSSQDEPEPEAFRDLHLKPLK